MASQKEKEFVVDGQVYTLGSFKHPGGSVINYYKGQDASDVFHALHFRSEKAKRYLRSIKSRDATADDPCDDSPLIKDFRKLREQLVKEGAFDPVWPIQIYRFAECLFLQWLSMWLLVNVSAVYGGLMYGLALGRIGFLMHDQGHRAFFGEMKWDKLIHKLFFGICITGAGSYWNNQHNKHHAATQELQHDVDLITLPVVAFHKKIARSASPAVRSYLRFQWFTFIPAQLLLFFSWKVLHLRHAIRSKAWLEVAAILAHQLNMFYCLRAGLGAYIVYESIGYAIGGWYLATTFSVNHTHHDVHEPHSKRNWVVRNADSTTNSDPTFFTRWVTGYLCFQIEHHLFPAMPHPRLQEVAPRVKALFKKHGQPYNCLPLHKGLVKVIVNLYNVGNPSEEELRKMK